MLRAIWLSFLFLSSTSLFAAPRQSGKILGSGDKPIKIELTYPKGGWTVDRMVKVAGTVSDTTVNPITVTINGDRYLLRTSGGHFSRKFPVAAGKNAISVVATNKAGTFKTSRTMYAKVPTVPIVAILTSDTDGIYTDLHVYEPKAGKGSPYKLEAAAKEHVYWAHTTSPSGGVFYLNEQGDSYDQPGYGPYLYTHSSPPLGFYRIDANYWPSGDKAHTLGTLNLVLFGGEAGEIRRTIRAPLAKPGETVTLAWIRFDKGRKASIYSPVMDSKPEANDIWPKWIVDFEPPQSGGGYEY